MCGDIRIAAQLMAPWADVKTFSSSRAATPLPAGIFAGLRDPSCARCRRQPILPDMQRERSRAAVGPDGWS